VTKNSLETDPATVALLKQMILMREDVMARKMNNKAMNALVKALGEQNFPFSAAAIVAKKRYLVKYYNDRKRLKDESWRFFGLVAQLVGDRDFDGTLAEPTLLLDRKFTGM